MTPTGIASREPRMVAALLPRRRSYVWAAVELPASVYSWRWFHESDARDGVRRLLGWSVVVVLERNEWLAGGLDRCVVVPDELLEVARRSALVVARKGMSAEHIDAARLAAMVGRMLTGAGVPR